MRGLTLPVAVATLSLALGPLAVPHPALAQTTPPSPPAASAPVTSPPASAPVTSPAPAADATTGTTTAKDPVIAIVGGDDIHESDLTEVAKTLPEQLRGMPQKMLYPMLLDQLIDRHAIVMQARKEGLMTDPAVEKQIARATDTALQNALLTREIQPTLTDAAIKARYEKDYADKPGVEEIHAAHILVATEAKAKDIIKQLDGGADFSKLANANSTDPSAKSNGGDLGFFKKTDMLPAFSDAAFALKEGQITQAPVQTRFGWHVIKLIGRRTSPPPTLDEVRNQVRQTLIQEGVTKALAQAKTGLKIEKFMPDGTPMTAAPATAPEPDPATTTAPAPAPAPAPKQ